MSDAGVEVPATAVPCGSCHGRDGKGRPEGGLSPSDLTWASLTQPYGNTHPNGRKHPAYDVRLLKRAISLGIDPAGNQLNGVMPRFRMSLQDMTDLVAYIQQLGTRSDPGVTDTALRVGVVLPPAGPLSGMGRAVRSALTARFEALNKEGGIYGRRVEPRFFEAPEPADQRRAWTADFLDREELFVGLASFFAGADAEMASLFQAKEIPVIGPFTLHPREAFPAQPLRVLSAARRRGPGAGAGAVRSQPLAGEIPDGGRGSGGQRPGPRGRSHHQGRRSRGMAEAPCAALGQGDPP